MKTGWSQPWLFSVWPIWEVARTFIHSPSSGAVVTGALLTLLIKFCPLRLISHKAGVKMKFWPRSRHLVLSHRVLHRRKGWGQSVQWHYTVTRPALYWGKCPSDIGITRNETLTNRCGEIGEVDKNEDSSLVIDRAFTVATVLVARSSPVCSASRRGRPKLAKLSGMMTMASMAGKTTRRRRWGMKFCIMVESWKVTHLNSDCESAWDEPKESRINWTLF